MPALVTPFKDGGVDHKTLSDLVEWHIAEGSNGLVPVGTTGESPTLSHEEHEEVIAAVVKTAAGRIPVIAGAGSNNTAEATRFVQFAEKVGADGALVRDAGRDHLAAARIAGHEMRLYQAGHELQIR